MDIEKLRFPIGQYAAPELISEIQVKQWINEISLLPSQLRAATLQLSEDQLNTPYRPGGWTAKQVIHHLADSHMNSYIRFKLAVTEENPTIRPYFEERWAECQEAKHADIEVSLNFWRHCIKDGFCFWSHCQLKIGTKRFIIRKIKEQVH